MNDIVACFILLCVFFFNFLNMHSFKFSLFIFSFIFGFFLLIKHLRATCYLSSFAISINSKFMLQMSTLYICCILLSICFKTCSLARLIC